MTVRLSDGGGEEDPAVSKGLVVRILCRDVLNCFVFVRLDVEGSHASRPS